MTQSVAIDNKTHGWGGPAVWALLAAIAVAAAAWGVSRAIDAYHDRVALRGLKDKTTPVRVVVADEPLVIPANMIRHRNARRGGALDKIDLLLHWPSLDGFTTERAAAFKDSSSGAPLIYATLEPRVNDIDSDRRLSTIYARFFDGPAFIGPASLIGRRLNPTSRYADEIVYHAPYGTAPFVTRCLAEATEEIPATCIRDINIGYGLVVRYRFNEALLANWRTMDDRLKRLFGQFFRRP
ncbi:hypothetical protein [Bauldia sp.]|uniref:hypothetical protein n=1 Tax=Bauldia sp. TaxID=2575872 RepID=UPI003BA983A9